MALRAPEPARWLIAVCIAAVLLGIGFRYSNAVHKTYYQDESITSLRLAGYTLSEEDRLFDDSARPFSQLQALLVPAPGRGVRDTVHSLIVEDPQHPPVYYGLEALWTREVGSSPLVTRLLSVLLSLLVLPLTYWLAIELFRSRTVACVATALMAVSPFFVLYAYQAREYGLLTAVILFSSTLFLRAERLGGWTRWLWYALSVALGMYTYLLFAAVVAAHVIVAFVRSIRRPMAFLPFLVSAAAGMLLAAPWLQVALTHRHVAKDDLGWATTAYPIGLMVEKWVFFAGATFFDLEYLTAKMTIVAVLVLAIALGAVVYLVRSGNRSAAVFLAALAGTTFLGLAIPDLLLHERFSTIARYLTPTWIALLIAVAGFVGSQQKTWIGKGLLAVLLIAGIVSNAVSSTSSSWWENNGNKSMPELAKYLTAHPGIVLIGSGDYAQAIDLAPLLPPNARWFGYRSGKPPSSAAFTGSEPIYLLSPDDSLVAQLRARHGTSVTIAYDSHDFRSNLTRFRSSGSAQHEGDNDWGEIVLWSVYGPAKFLRSP